LNLMHPSEAFRKCTNGRKTKEEVLEAVQYGVTRSGLRYMSLRGFPTWAAHLVLPG
jgi:hypothetical protein